MDVQTSDICRLCLKVCEAHDFDVIEETHHEFLNVLPFLDSAITHEPVICKQCADNLRKCFVFKTVALYTEAEPSEGSNRQNIAMDVCLFCKKLSTDSLASLNSDMVLLRTIMEQYLPELNLPTIERAVVCKMCLESLKGNLKFIASCLTVEDRIKRYCEAVGTNSKGQVELKDVVRLTTGTDQRGSSNVIKIESEVGEKMIVPNLVKTEETLSENETLDQKLKVETDTECGTKLINDEIDFNMINEDVKIEETWIKVENGEKSVDTITECIEAVVRQWRDYNQSKSAGISTPTNSDHTETTVKVEANKESSNKSCEDSTTTRTIARDKPEKRVYRKWWSNSPPPAIGDEDGPPPLTYTKTVLRSMITRVTFSGVKKYQCQVCKFVAKAKCSMNRHMQLHQDPSEIPLYECHVCGLKTKHKYDLRQHIKRHDSSYVTLFKYEPGLVGGKRQGVKKETIVSDKDDSDHCE